MAWLYDVTKLTPSILACGLARQMIRCPCIHSCLHHLIRKCLIISTGIMTILYAVTSWSWRLVTVSQISFHLSKLDNILQLSNMYVNLVNWHVKIKSILVYSISYDGMTSHRDVMTWRYDMLTAAFEHSIDDLFDTNDPILHIICIVILVWLNYKISWVL